MSAAFASLGDECGFGKTIDYSVSESLETVTTCTPQIWDLIDNNDGFARTLTVYIDADNQGYSDLGTETTHTIEIQCTSKKLSVLIYSDPIGIYPSTDLQGFGVAQARIDNGKIANYSYVGLKDSSGIFVVNAKTLTSAILKGKTKVSFKINSSIQNATVANFAISNLAKYASRFKSAGCPLK